MSNTMDVNRYSSKIGIITGSGPEAGIDMWTKVVQASRSLQGASYRGDLDAPNVTLFSEPRLGLSMELEENDSIVWDCLRQTAQTISARVDYYAIASNTLNYYQDRLEALCLPSRLVSFADTVLDYVNERGVKRVALLGARPVTDMGPWSHYRKLAGRIDVELPNATVAENLHQLICDIKARDNTPELRDAFTTILGAMESDVVLLACTELPLVYVEHERKKVVDVTDLVARKLARLTLSNG